MKTMELNKMGLTPLDPGELKGTEGGGWLTNLLRRITLAGVQKIIVLCKQLGIDDFAEKLPSAYHTLLNEQGCKPTTKDCDEILVLKEGKLIEQGHHDYLINLNGEYSKLWHHHTGHLA